uniref:Protein amnionless n=2 Tax=Ciona intestinalis TaxID=7719 RepID=H2XR15_CIOIN
MFRSRVLVLLFRGLLLLSAFTACYSKQYTQTFVSNSNFDNPERWVGHGVPCAEDSIVFNEDQVVSIFVQTNASIKELYFPLNGEFIFADGVVWSADESLSPCVGDDHGDHVLTYNSDPYNWFDIGNWQGSDENGDELSSKDLLDIEKIPCDFDTAAFPLKQSWMVSMPEDINLHRLVIWNQDFDSATFSNYRTTGRGRYQFTGSGVISAERAICSDVTGCACR